MQRPRVGISRRMRRLEMLMPTKHSRAQILRWPSPRKGPRGERLADRLDQGVVRRRPERILVTQQPKDGALLALGRPPAGAAPALVRCHQRDGRAPLGRRQRPVPSCSSYRPASFSKH
jgi:hypothetical protein